jgi:tRNA-dihydrouridine synthase C
VIVPHQPALVFAPMDGITDAPMRALMGEVGGFDYCVTEFVRVSGDVLPPKVFRRDIPELSSDCLTTTGLPVQLQILGGDPERLAMSALNAVRAGALSIDINFGCPAPTVNRNDGGASILRDPPRLREIVRAVRAAVPAELPVSAKLRLGWESIDEIHLNADMAAEGGASWITIHARTRMQSYRPPVYWPHIGVVRNRLGIPVVANGDIWTLDDFRRCREETGCEHFMLGRAAMVRPYLVAQVCTELGKVASPRVDMAWLPLFRRFAELRGDGSNRTLFRLKQWAKMASLYGEFPWFEQVKTASTADEFLAFFARRQDLANPKSAE